MKHIFRLIAVLALLGAPSSVLAADLRDLSWEGNFHLLNEGGTVSLNTFTIDGPTLPSDDKFAMLYQMPRADTITKLCVRYGTATGTPVAHQISLQTPSAVTFGPNGTILGAANNGKAAFTPTAGNNNTWQCFTLTASVTVTQGQKVAVVVESTGTPSGSNSESFGISLNNINGREYFPVMATRTNAGAWTRVDGMPVMALQSASTTYGFPLLAYEETSVSGTGATPNEYANAITMPAADCSTFKMPGITCMFPQVPAANTLITATLYSGTTALAHTTLDSDEAGMNNESYRTLKFIFDTADSGALADARTCGTKYYYAIKMGSVSNNMLLADISLSAAGDMDAYLNGQNEFMSTRTGAGAWTDVTTKRFLCTPIIGDITTGAGGVVPALNLNGGFQ